jgi:zona occludens toxin
LREGGAARVVCAAAVVVSSYWSVAVNLVCVSGRIGNGKTLWVIEHVEKKRLDEHREVWYHGIPGLTLPWKQLPLAPSGYSEKEVKEKRMPAMVPDWRAAPTGSIIVIDEAWEFFPKRSQGSKPPEYVEQLANVRRMGLDLFLITQDPMQQLDTFVRSFIVEHVFLERKFGMQYSMAYIWDHVHDQTARADLAVAQSSRWIFPKEFFGVYKSAEEHTVKAKLPWKKLATLVGALVVVVAGFSYAFHRLRPEVKGTQAVDSSGRPAGVIVKDLTGDFWVRDRRERVAGVPASAPVYDSLQKVRSQPRPEGCMQMTIGRVLHCECTGPNHSVLEISTGQCIDFVKHGWFDETRVYADAKKQNIDALNAGLKGSVSTVDSGEAKPGGT